MVVPGSMSVKAQAEREGLDRVFATRVQRQRGLLTPRHEPGHPAERRQYAHDDQPQLKDARDAAAVRTS
jgi:hypothetical protein